MNERKLVFISTPYKVNCREAAREGPLGGTDSIKVNIAFARAACLYAIQKGFVPIAPHLIYPDILPDDDPAMRALGIEMGCRILAHCDEMWVCGPCVSAGMRLELGKAAECGVPVRHVSSEEIQSSLAEHAGLANSP